MMEGDLEIKDYEYDVGGINLITWDNILKHNKVEITDISMLEVFKLKLHHCSIMAKTSIFIICFVISGIPNLIIKLSLG